MNTYLIQTSFGTTNPSYPCPSHLGFLLEARDVKQAIEKATDYLNIKGTYPQVVYNVLLDQKVEKVFILEERGYKQVYPI